MLYLRSTFIVALLSFYLDPNNNTTLKYACIPLSITARYLDRQYFDCHPEQADRSLIKLSPERSTHGGIC